MSVRKKVRMGELLLSNKVVTDDQLTQALEEQRRTGRKLGRVLADLGFIDERSLHELLARHLNLQFVDLRKVQIDREAVKLLPDSQRFAVQAHGPDPILAIVEAQVAALHRRLHDVGPTGPRIAKLAQVFVRLEIAKERDRIATQDVAIGHMLEPVDLHALEAHQRARRLALAGDREDDAREPPRHVLLAQAALHAHDVPQVLFRRRRQDITTRSGLDFVHESGPTGTYFMPESIGSGGALFDFDNDGRLDVYLLHCVAPGSKSRHRLYHQEADNRFRDVSAGSGLDVAGHGMGVAVGDVNNDGWPDVLVTEYGAARLFLNRGGGKFQDASAAAARPPPPEDSQ